MQAQARVLLKSKMGELVKALGKDRRVVGPVAKENQFVFEPLNGGSELRMDYPISVLPPKKFFMPQYETLLAFRGADPSAVEIPDAAVPTVILGMHPWDVSSTWLLDKVFSSRNKDPYYLSKRDRAVVIALDAKAPANDTQFCADMGSLYPKEGWDLWLQDLGDRYYVRVGTEAGQQIVDATGLFAAADNKDRLAHEQFESEKEANWPRRLPMDGSKIPELLGESYDSLIWDAIARRCFSCGSCNLVCPTCYCFNVVDELDMDLSSGQRKRNWDGCQLRNFSEVAGGENFREAAAERLRHRVMRKGKYMHDQFGHLGCVGCGRCDRHCVASISIRSIFQQVMEEKLASQKLVAPVIVPPRPDGQYIPREGKVVACEQFTPREKWYRIHLTDGGGLDYKVGQFVECSIFGVGEAPISICTAPDGSGDFELCVRAVGDLTRRLHTIEVGQSLGIRGPFGNGYDMASCHGDDLVFVAGGLGLAPCRSFIQGAFAGRDKYGKMTILYGARTPEELLYRKDLHEWAQRTDCDLHITVDRPNEQWVGNVGVITTLFKDISIEANKTTVFIIGPPVMFKYAVMEVLALGVPEGKILCSLERRMKCGLGKCGHCQIRDVYVCQDGPVFNYAQVKRLREGI
ncbi:MAG: Dihydroorotate dehydrogenase B (NAD(+)), electron transfer subunit [Phycisphaerae bacterium]|nr:Dihydroorotate dehydrogenase B (NAD(+)), electron transfer subunit [Phycisphaerae bacterium]